MLYFYDSVGRYVGCRARTGDEPIPEYATETPVEVPDGHEAHFANGSWAVTETIIPSVDPVESEPTTEEKLAAMAEQLNDATATLLDTQYAVMLLSLRG